MFKEIKANKLSISGRKPVLGLATNDADYITQLTINGKRAVCPFYRTWYSMLLRCYSAKSQEKSPTYIGCSVADEWLLFSNFKNWMENQDWKGKALDKDVLDPGNKAYSPSACVFITVSVNSLITEYQARRGQYPQGVNYDGDSGRFRARCRIDGADKWLGYFDTAEEAATKYNAVKAKEIIKIAHEQTDPRVRDGLLKHAKIRLKSELV